MEVGGSDGRRVSLCVLVAAAAIVLSGAVSLCCAYQDPEPKECMRQCRHEEQRDKRQIRSCEKECEDYYRKREPGDRQRDDEKEHEENPYSFGEEHFSTVAETDEGRVRLLGRFTERSSLLKGIENYRIGIVEANPRTFVVPAHSDADSILFVARGQGTIKVVEKNRVGRMNVRQGDVARVEAGATTYAINGDRREKLFVVQLLKSASLPGHVQSFVGAGGDNPESFYRAFDEDLLAAALNAKKGALEKILRRQSKGWIMRATDEQIRSMTGRDGGQEGGRWTFGSDFSRRSFNLLEKRPAKSNEHGKIHDADWEDLEELRDMEIGVSYVNITGGSMAGPFYNTRATKVAVVMRGEGHFEMACPHMSSRDESDGRRERGGPAYRAVSADLRPGMVLVVPAGHPMAVIAAGGRRKSKRGHENLEVLCFSLNQKGNERRALAGRDNVVSLLESAAKELAFDAPSREVDQVFQRQPEEFFFKGPEEWRSRERIPAGVARE